MMRDRPPIPSATRQAVYERAGGVCESCGCRPIGQRHDFHHLHYETVGEETPADLQLLCRDCHDVAHRDINGDFWRDPNEMFHYWYTYFEEIENPNR